MTNRPLAFEQIVAHLDESLEVEFSFYETRKPAMALATMPSRTQRFVLDWVRRASSINTALGYEFLQRAGEALDKLDMEMIESWLLAAMNSYDRHGLRAALEIVQDMESFIEQGRERRAGALFEQHEAVLTHFVAGLPGRDLELRVADTAVAYTDSEILFLPPVIARLDHPKENFRLYKCMVAHLWAQTRFGTFQVELQELIEQFPDSQRALGCFHALECIRLDACIERELPGLHRDMLHLTHMLDRQPDSIPEYARYFLQEPVATVHTTVELLRELHDEIEPVVRCYQGCLDPRAVARVRTERMEREKLLVRVALRALANEHGRIVNDDERKQSRFSIRKQNDSVHELGFTIELDEEQLVPPVYVSNLITSVMLDFGEIPEEYLQPAGEGEYDIARDKPPEIDPAPPFSGIDLVEGTYLYKEWDYRRKHYRKNWCVLREIEVEGGDDAFYARTKEKYRGLILSLRRTFELLRGEDKLLKREPFGDDIDIDALVDAWPDFIKGNEVTGRLFTRMQKDERNIAVMFMVDMSGSTRGWINEAEREALILMAESLEVLGDRYAIYGFSGWARERCEAYRIKDFDDSLDVHVRRRICSIEARDYTRMGAPIRHLVNKLHAVEARIKVLITLSDGKPDDEDPEYCGPYGIEDTRMALYEARREGVHAYCITIDREGKDYLPHMYGAANYTVIDRVEKLPLKITDIYRKLTS